MSIIEQMPQVIEDDLELERACSIDEIIDACWDTDMLDEDLEAIELIGREVESGQALRYLVSILPDYGINPGSFLLEHCIGSWIEVT